MATSSEVPAASASGGRESNVGVRVLLGFTLYQSFLTTGIIYGWPAMLILLRREGVYAFKCDQASPDCNERAVAFNLVFTLGAVVNVSGGLLLGRLVDILGPRNALQLGVWLSLSGSVMVAFAPADTQATWPLAYILYGLGGTIAHPASFSIGNLFGTARALVVSILVAVFSLSALTFQLALLAYNSGVSRRNVFLAHAALQGVNVIASGLLWAGRPYQSEDTLRCSHWRLRILGGDRAEANGQRGSIRDVCQLAGSVTFIGFIFFQSVHLWMSRCLMGWMESEIAWKDEQLRDDGDEGLDTSAHLALFNSCQSVLGLPTIPAFGWVVARFGPDVAPFVCTNLLAVAWLSLLLVPTEWSLYSVYLISSLHRQFFFSTFFTFLISRFPTNHFATLSGIGCFVAGLLTYTQNPILQVVLSRLDGDFTIPIITQLVLALGLLAAIPLKLVFKRLARRGAQDISKDIGDDDKIKTVIREDMGEHRDNSVQGQRMNSNHSSPEDLEGSVD